MRCLYCESALHPWWDCPKRPADWKPPKKSTSKLTLPAASRVHSEQSGLGQGLEAPVPVDTTTEVELRIAKPEIPDGGLSLPDSRNRDRHKPGYMAEYMRQRRAKLKEGK